MLLSIQRNRKTERGGSWKGSRIMRDNAKEGNAVLRLLTVKSSAMQKY
jgi:hypothetical protein